MTTSANQARGIFTIGHSNHGLDQFIRLLEEHRISAVADVRSVPYSKRQPQFNRETLKNELKERGIQYVFLGKELGARSEDPKCYDDGRVQYRKLAVTDLFRSGINRVLEGSRKMSIALMCAEKEPLDCHRTILVARELVALGMEVNHILADGALELHQSTMKRLQANLGLLRDNDLFEQPETLEDEAYRAREASIAYVDREFAAEVREDKR